MWSKKKKKKKEKPSQQKSCQKWLETLKSAKQVQNHERQTISQRNSEHISEYREKSWNKGEI